MRTENKDPLDGARQGPWGDPEPVELPLPPVPSFDADLLPEPLKSTVIDIAERLQVPPEMPAAALLVALSGAIGRQCVIRPKRNDPWNLVINLWGAFIVDAGTLMKSVVLAEAFRALQQIQKGWFDEHGAACRAHEVAVVQAEAQRQCLRAQLSDCLRKKQSTADVIGQLEELVEPEPPVMRRILINDGTVEKIGEIHRDNPHGLVLVSDEIVGLFRTFDQRGREGDRAFYLSAWSGDQPRTWDRIGRGTIHVPALCMSMFGCAQPGPIARYVHGALDGGAGSDGFVQRLQLLVYPDTPTSWRNVDRARDENTQRAMRQCFEKLVDMEATTLGAELDPATKEAPPHFRFRADAQEVFDEFQYRLEHRLRAKEEHTAILSHLAKFRSLMPSLALVTHLIEVAAKMAPPGPVPHAAAQRAVTLCTFFEAHAHRLYGSVTQGRHPSAELLARRITAGKLSDAFTVRDVYRPGWTGLASTAEAGAAVNTLVKLGWLRPVTIRAGRKSKVVHVINPKILQL